MVDEVVLPFELGVDLRHFHEDFGAGLGEEGHKAQLDAILLYEAFLEFIA